MGKTIKSLRRNPDAPLWRDVLKSIKAKPKLAFYFAKPVDHVALNIPLYPTIVKDTDGPPDHRKQIGGQ